MKNCLLIVLLSVNISNNIYGQISFVSGKEHGTCGKGVCINTNGNIYHTGKTGANLFSDVKGEHDMYLLKLKLDTKKIIP